MLLLMLSFVRAQIHPARLLYRVHHIPCHKFLDVCGGSGGVPEPIDPSIRARGKGENRVSDGRGRTMAAHAANTRSGQPYRQSESESSSTRSQQGNSKSPAEKAAPICECKRFFENQPFK